MRRKDIKENPDLRFPEFAEKYLYQNFSEVLTKKARSLKMEDGSEYRLVTVKRGYGGVVLRGEFKGEKILVKSQFSLKTNDFLISKRQICHNACGIVPAYLEGAIVSNEYTIFMPRNGLNVHWFSYFCCTSIVSHTFFLSSVGVHIEKMLFKVDDWLKWEFPFPTLQEQKKIASFLSSVDKKIEQLTCKKELLEQYKKGVMQKIFSQEIRFKGENGQDYPDWEEKRLADVGKMVGGGTPSTRYSDFWSGNIPWVSSSDLTEKSIRHIGFTRFITQNALNSSATKLIPPNSVLIVTRVGVGKIAINNCEMCTSQDFTSIVQPQCSPIFLAYFIKNQIKRLLCYNQGTSIKGIVKSDLKELVVPIPLEEEQTKIANFLTSVDSRITSVKIQLIQTQNFKKGLLQKMFV